MGNKKIKKTYLLLWLMTCSVPVLSQQIDWDRVEKMSEGALSEVYSQSRISVSWIDGSTWLTYNERENGQMNYYMVNPYGRKQPIFRDNADFVRQYVKLTEDTTITADDIKLYGLSMRNNNPNRLYWTRRGKHLMYNRTTGKLAIDTDYKQKTFNNLISGFGRSPHTTDSLYTMLGDRYNLYIKDNRSGDTTQITFDGKENASYCYNGSKPELRAGNVAGNWYGHVFIDFVYDDSEVGDLYILNAISGHRPKLRTKKMPLPNEKGVRRFKLFWYNADTRQGKLLPIQGTMTDPTISLAYNNSKDTLWFTRRSRSVDTLQLCRINLHTGDITEVITEVSKPHLNLTFSGYRFIRGGREIIWWSERTGRGHYYLYDVDGRLKNKITRGNKLVAGNISFVDEKAGFMVFAGYGQEASSDPGYTYYYKVDLLGKNQQLLTPGDGTHELNFADDRRYAIDTYSRMDMLPMYQIIDLKHPGKVHEFARTSDKALRATGWQPPVLVKVKAADNVTDLYGVMYLPTNLDKNKKYPIISNVYPGPQDDQLPRRFTLDDNGNQSLAEMGFVVINVAPRGSGPLRGRDFYCFSYGNLRDYPLADDKHTIKTLASRYSFIDLDRVGIYGHSGGGFMTATAIMTYPEFYKVGVAASGNYDNNNYIQWWGETFHGLVPQDSIPTTMQLKENLKGKLLLISGDVDDNVPWASTLRLADALIRHNKRFDMMVLPGKDHGVWSPYYVNLIRYYFMEHLINPWKRDFDIIKHTK